jgi:hypothetical protein
MDSTENVPARIQAEARTLKQERYHRYYLTHSEKIAAYRKKWRAENPERSRELSLRRWNSGKIPQCYKSWVAMRQRCTNPANKNFPRYGARGILVCERWNSFKVFLSDMGDRPKNWDLHRKDRDGDYVKENCVWLPKSEHTRITRRGTHGNL